MFERASKEITLAYVAGNDPDVGARVLSHCSGIFPVASVLLCAPTAPEEPYAGEFVPIAPLNYAEWGQFVVSSLAEHVKTPHVLIVHPDGFVLNPARWDESFLDCDYIGAPWPWVATGSRVGNGGFSLRSKRLLEWGRGKECTERNEDMFVCQRSFDEITGLGMTFAPVDVAARFSMEDPIPEGVHLDKAFGFHGAKTDRRRQVIRRVCFRG